MFCSDTRFSRLAGAHSGYTCFHIVSFLVTTFGGRACGGSRLRCGCLGRHRHQRGEGRPAFEGQLCRGGRRFLESINYTDLKTERIQSHVKPVQNTQQYMYIHHQPHQIKCHHQSINQSIKSINQSKKVSFLHFDVIHIDNGILND